MKINSSTSKIFECFKNLELIQYEGGASEEEHESNNFNNVEE